MIQCDYFDWFHGTGTYLDKLFGQIWEFNIPKHIMFCMVYTFKCIYLLQLYLYEVIAIENGYRMKQSTNSTTWLSF